MSVNTERRTIRWIDRHGSAELRKGLHEARMMPSDCDFCKEESPDSVGWNCCRRLGHSGDHMAFTTHDLVARWKQEESELSTVRIKVKK